MVVEQQAIRKQKGGFKKIEPRWKPGQSGNPAGRPVNSVTALLKNQDPLTNKSICDKLIELAQAGDLPAIKEYLDRTDGKVTDKVAVLQDTTIRFIIGKGYDDATEQS